MGLKEQFVKLKDNWLIVLLVVVLFLFMSGSSVLEQSVRSIGGYSGYGIEESANDRGLSKSAAYYPSYDTDDFAPEVESRVKIKTSSLQTEVERGTFFESAERFKSIITTADGFILNENVNKYGEKRREYYSGSYTLKVDTKKYNAVISQLRKIGEITSFSENERDVTGTYTDLNTELEAEKARLERYQEMYDEATEVEDKINLNDRIFNQERTIKYYEERIENIDKRVEYSTISFYMTEKRSDYADLAFVKFSDLIKGFVSSTARLFSLLFVVLPWLVGIGMIYGIYRLVKRR